jgi:hypothetical protein
MASSGTFTVVRRGTHLLRVIADDTFGDTPEDWSLAYDDAGLLRVYGDPPRVVDITDATPAGKGGALWYDLKVDIAILPDVSFVLTAPAFAGGTSPSPDSRTFVGMRTSRAPATELEGEFLDVDAPLLRPDGPGGDYRVVDGGDRKVSGGLATVEKAVWWALLRDDAEVRVKSPRATDLDTTQARLTELVEAVPNVQGAHVLVLFDADTDHARVKVHASTSFGRLDTERKVQVTYG